MIRAKIAMGDAYPIDLPPAKQGVVSKRSYQLS
jgi:hypothetical protein